MNDIPGMQPSAGWALWSLLSFGAMLVAGFVLTRLALRKESPITRNGTSATLGNIAREFGWLTAPAIVIATFTGISWIGNPPVINQTAPFRSVMPAPVPVPMASAFIPVPTDDRTTSASADAQSHRPAWVDQPLTNDGITEQFVLASQQYTTREEAEEELLAGATKVLERDVQQLYPNAGQSSWKPSPDEIRRVMVKQKYVEVIERDFGNFFHPMYRVWWQLELSPEVRTEFLPGWKQGLTSNRIRQIGLVAGSLVLVASLVTMNRRLNMLLRGSSSIVPKFLTSAVAVLWVVVLIYQVRTGIF